MTSKAMGPPPLGHSSTVGVTRKPTTTHTGGSSTSSSATITKVVEVVVEVEVEVVVGEVNKYTIQPACSR